MNITIWSRVSTAVIVSLVACGAITHQARAESGEGTAISASGTGAIIDAAGNSYTIASGRVSRNGVADTRTSGVNLLLFYNGLIYQEITAGDWWSTSGANWPLSVWTTLGAADPRVESANGATSPNGTSIVDAERNVYSIANGVIEQNGIADTRTSTVILLLFYDGRIYQEISKKDWWSTDGSKWPESVWETEPGDPRVTATPSPSPSPKPSASPSPKPSASPSPKPSASPSPKPSASPTETVPAGAQAAGFTKNVFNSDFTQLPLPTSTETSEQILVNSKLVDAGNTEAAGFSWYPKVWFSNTVTNPSDLSLVNDGGTHALRLSGASSDSLYGRLKGKDGVVGNDYSGGAYFEAKIAMALPVNGAGSWPSFWALQNLDGSKINWPGSTATNLCGGTTGTYDDNVEIDIMEFMPLSELGGTIPKASATLHNWYGVQYCSCGTKGFCQNAASFRDAQSSSLTLQSTTSKPVFNTFGALWVPATATAGGYIQFYYNNAPLGSKVPWTSDPPSKADPIGLMSGNSVVQWPSSLIPSWAFGATDLYPYSLILDTGGAAFMDVQYVRVWQK